VRPRLALALAGGGFLGAAYELGALAALDESIEGLKLSALDVYVGVSAGAFLAAGLANGLSPHAMVRLFIESEDADIPFDPATLLRPAWSELGDRIGQVPGLVSGLLDESRRALRRGGVGPTGLRMLTRAGMILPTGLVDATPAEVKLASLFSRPGMSNHFDELPSRLRIVATDLDRGEAVAFGAPGLSEVPISRAVRASSAVPGLFAPVKIQGRWFVDGALNKTLHASIALHEGATLVLCVNPLVPFSPSPDGMHTPIAERGMGAVLSQSIRTAIRSRMTVGLEKYATTHPNADVLLFEPRRDDAITFLTRIFSVSSRRELCEHAYQQTRHDLLARASSLDPILRRHGLQLNRASLSDTDRTLVRMSGRRVRPLGALGRSLRRLSHSLDDLDLALARLR
jgi:predicted acylesterase/phospholipase RssA